MEPRFDFGVFSRQAANAPSGAPQSEDGQWWIDGEYDVVRKDGIRVALETADREDDRQFRGRFIETLGPEFDFDLALESVASRIDRDVQNICFRYGSSRQT